MEQQYITALDYALIPLALFIIFFFGIRYRNNYYPSGHPLRIYFIPALLVKLVGALFIGIIYAYYYKSGDTFNFFYHSRIINSSLDESFIKWVNLLFKIPDYNDVNYYKYTSQMFWYNSNANYTVSAFGAFCSVLFFNTYLPASLIFAVVSFTGGWALFILFSKMYPRLVKPLSVCILFVPSVVIWGSGIFKDTLCLAGLGWLIYGLFHVLIYRQYKSRNFLIIILGLVMLYLIKVYILATLMPALLVWLLLSYTKRIKSSKVRFGTNIFLTTILIVATLYIMNQANDLLGRYSLDNVVETSASTRNYIYRVSGDDGSGYSLGEFTPGIGGLLLKLPQAINVTLFRPYPWEAKKLIVFLTSGEAVIFLLVTIKLLLSVPLKKIIKSIRSDSTIQFCLIFSLVFAFSVGISSYNFGALSRYKIPCLSFYLISITLIYYLNVPRKRLLGNVM